MQRQISEIERENTEIISQIQDDTRLEIADIEDKNESNKSQVNEMALKSKAELQITRNRIDDVI